MKNMDKKGHGVNLYVENLATSMEIVSLGDLVNPVKVREYEGYNVPVDAQLRGNTSVVHIDGVGVASFELIDDLAAVPFFNN